MEKKAFYENAYLWFALAFGVTAAGFYPSYFSRLTETGAAHHFHGITATLWMLTLVVQPLLYRYNKMKWHRLIGKTTFLLVPMIVMGGLIMVSYMLNDERYPGFLAYQLAYIDFFVISTFLLFYILAIKNVHNTHYHARYMACTVFGILIPALARLLRIVPGITTFSQTLHISFALVEITILLLILDDKRKGKIRLPYVLALFLMVVQHLTMHVAAEWEWWRWLMDLYAGISL